MSGRPVQLGLVPVPLRLVPCDWDGRRRVSLYHQRSMAARYVWRKPTAGSEHGVTDVVTSCGRALRHGVTVTVTATAVGRGG